MIRTPRAYSIRLDLEPESFKRNTRALLKLISTRTNKTVIRALSHIPIPMYKNTVTLTLAFNWKISVLAFLMLPVLVNLGFWQLERAEEKYQLLKRVAAQRAMPPVGMDELNQENDIAHRKFQLVGQFGHQRYWLLDNKIRQGKAGYEVIVPFIMNSGEAVLVNRGWVSAPRLRSQIPHVPSVDNTVTIQGVLYRPGRNVLASEVAMDELWGGGEWPKRIQFLDIAGMYRQLNLKSNTPYVLRLDGISDAALVTDWRWVNTDPKKHEGYAVQWFSMAVVLCVALVFANSNMARVIQYRFRLKQVSRKIQ